LNRWASQITPNRYISRGTGQAKKKDLKKLNKTDSISYNEKPHMGRPYNTKLWIKKSQMFDANLKSVTPMVLKFNFTLETAALMMTRARPTGLVQDLRCWKTKPDKRANFITKLTRS